MYIEKEKNNLIISFRYNPTLIEIVKKFENRKYNPSTKEWTIPIVHIRRVLNRLVPLGFKTTQDVLDVYNRELEKRKKIEKIIETCQIDDIVKKLKLPMFNYQQHGTTFLNTIQSGVLGDEPGLGKSIQSLAIMLMINAEKTIIFCPSSLKLNWRDEIQKWLEIDETEIIIISGTKEQRNKLWKKNAKIFIINYELLLRDSKEIKTTNWDLLIADEATRISNPKAKQSKLIKKIKAKRRLALTGTPLNNAVQDIWNILDFCHPNILGTYWQFTNKYCTKDKFGGISGYKNLDLLKQTLKYHMIRRLKSEVLHELPEKLYENIYIEQSDAEKKVYKAIKENLKKELVKYEINKLSDDKHLSNILVKMVRLKQATGSLKLISDRDVSSKLSVLKELLNDILHNESKTIIYTQFAQMADILEKELEEYNPLMIIGRTPKKTRHENVKKFTKEEQHRIIIMTEAGSFGLNLGRANYIIHYDLPWSISKMEQREGRAEGLRQKNKLTIYKLIVSNSIDEYILKVLFKKQKLSKELLGDKVKVRRVKITRKEIRDILN